MGHIPRRGDTTANHHRRHERKARHAQPAFRNQQRGVPGLYNTAIRASREALYERLRMAATLEMPAARTRGTRIR